MTTTRSRNAEANLELLTIYEVSKLLSSSLDLRQTLSELMHLLSSELDMRRGSVCLVDGEGTLRIVGSYGLSLEEMERGHYKSGEGIIGTILKSGMPAVVPNLAEEPLFLNRTLSRVDVEEMVVSLVGVPIKAGGETIGVMTIDRISDEGPTRGFDADVRFLTMVANLIGQTVRLHQTVAEERQQMMAERFRLQKEVRAEYRVDSVVGSSRKMQDVLAQVHRVAPFRSTVLIRGESGTGKELVARAIHNLSPRKDNPFIRINCAALPESLLESELFGYEKGAFTGATHDRKGRFEMANGGTLFLDEIGDISASFQAKLLRVLQEQEFERVGSSKTIRTDVRIIAATNVNLEEAVAQGKFRADLYYRINVVSVFLPPLRDRREDVIPLALHFVDTFAESNSMDLKIEDGALDVLKRCPWPGNVRELENCIERAATLSRDGVIRPVDLSCHSGLCYSSTLWQYRAASSNTAGIPAGVGGPNGGAPAHGGMAAHGGPMGGPMGGPAHGGAVHSGGMSGPMAGSPAAGAGSFAGGHGGANGGSFFGAPGGGCPPGGCGGGLPGPIPSAEEEADTDQALSDPNPGEGEPVFTNPRDRLIWAMERAGWVQAKAARLLGLTTRQVSYALRKYEIEIKKI